MQRCLEVIESTPQHLYGDSHKEASELAKQILARLDAPSKQIRAKGYWTIENLQKELEAYIEGHGTRGLMPTSSELEETGQVALKSAIEKHGGFIAVAERFGLQLNTQSQNIVVPRPRGFWQDDDNLVHTLRVIAQMNGTPHVMPTAQEIKDAGYPGLNKVIARRGGYAVVAGLAGLHYGYGSGKTDIFLKQQVHGQLA